MKIKSLITMLMAVIMMAVSVDASAQVATKKERKQIEKHEKLLNKEIRDKAVKQARKEAKRLKKQKYQVRVGAIPMDKQLEDSWQAAYEVDADGYPYYIMSTQSAISTNYTAAQMQAMNSAKLDIAGQIETQVHQIIESKIATNELTPGEAASVNSYVSASKNVITNTLGRVIKFIEFYRTLKNGNTEVMVTVGYNSDLATKEALKALKKNLSSEATDLMQQLDKLLLD